MSQPLRSNLQQISTSLVDLVSKRLALDTGSAANVDSICSLKAILYKALEVGSEYSHPAILHACYLCRRHMIEEAQSKKVDVSMMTHN